MALRKTFRIYKTRKLIHKNYCNSSILRTCPKKPLLVCKNKFRRVMFCRQCRSLYQYLFAQRIRDKVAVFICAHIT